MRYVLSQAAGMSVAYETSSSLLGFWRAATALRVSRHEETMAPTSGSQNHEPEERGHPALRAIVPLPRIRRDGHRRGVRRYDTSAAPGVDGGASPRFFVGDSGRLPSARAGHDLEHAIEGIRRAGREAHGGQPDCRS